MAQIGQPLTPISMLRPAEGSPRALVGIESNASHFVVDSFRLSETARLDAARIMAIRRRAAPLLPKLRPTMAFGWYVSSLCPRLLQRPAQLATIELSRAAKKHVHLQLQRESATISPSPTRWTVPVGLSALSPIPTLIVLGANYCRGLARFALTWSRLIRPLSVDRVALE